MVLVWKLMIDVVVVNVGVVVLLLNYVIYDVGKGSVVVLLRVVFLL